MAGRFKFSATEDDYPPGPEHGPPPTGFARENNAENADFRAGADPNTGRTRQKGATSGGSGSAGFAQAGDNGNKKNEPWPDPKPLENLLLPVPPMRPDMLPEQLRGWLPDLADRMQCPLDLLAPAAITMLGSLVGTACRIRPKSNDSWEEVPNFYGGTVSPPGTMKTPAISAVFKIIDKLEARSREAHAESMKDYELQKEKYDARRKVLLSKLRKIQQGAPKAAKEGQQETAEDIEQELRNLSEPTMPVWRRFKQTTRPLKSSTRLSPKTLAASFRLQTNSPG